MQFLLSIAREDDLEDLSRMRLSLQDHMESRNPHLASMSETRRSEISTLYASRLSDESSRIVVANSISTDRIIGMAIGSIAERDDLVPSIWGRIDDVWVDPSERRKGVASGLLQTLLEFFQERHVSSVVLEYAVGNGEAESMWRSSGFEPIMTSAVGDVRQMLSKVGSNDS